MLSRKLSEKRFVLIVFTELRLSNVRDNHNIVRLTWWSLEEIAFLTIIVFHYHPAITRPSLTDRPFVLASISPVHICLLPFGGKFVFREDKLQICHSEGSCLLASVDQAPELERFAANLTPQLGFFPNLSSSFKRKRVFFSSWWELLSKIWASTMHAWAGMALNFSGGNKGWPFWNFAPSSMMQKNVRCLKLQKKLLLGILSFAKNIYHQSMCFLVFLEKPFQEARISNLSGNSLRAKLLWTSQSPFEISFRLEA